jgi:holo-[acyl-carrier protein] synthase
MLQVGVDCEEIARFKRLPYSKNERFYRRIFTPQEIGYCTSYRDPYPRFAARFAAKEATIKALNRIARPSYADIEVQKDKSEHPKIYIDKNRIKIQRRLNISLSLTHSRSYAVAFVVITDKRRNIKKISRSLKKNILYVKKRMQG